MLDYSQWLLVLQRFWQTVLVWLASPYFYAQVVAIIVAVPAAGYLTRFLISRFRFLNTEPLEGRFLAARSVIYRGRDLFRPFLLYVLLAFAAQICDHLTGSSWVVRGAQSLAIIVFLYEAINRFMPPSLLNSAMRWFGIPTAAIYVFGYMPQVISWLDSSAFEAGNIRVSLLTILKAVVFGGSLFWLGRLSLRAGQSVIRQQETLDVQTRQLAIKGFDLFVVCFFGLLLLNLLGIDLSILAVFSGAVGVGLGFGLQQIASNFVSGVIILIERSMKVGDFIELEDGRSGHLMEINMRQTRLGTYDGKDIMVPNDRFITTRVVNWTHADLRQRYEVPFTVTYDTDIRKVSPLIVKTLMKVKGVLKDPALPICELKSFGDTTVHFTVKFWVQGIDDGKNNYSSDVLFAIWDALKSEGINMKPPPQKIQYIVAAPPPMT